MHFQHFRVVKNDSEQKGSGKQKVCSEWTMEGILVYENSMHIFNAARFIWLVHGTE